MTPDATIDTPKLDSATLRKASPLDVGERVFLLITLGWFVARLSLSLKTEPANLLIMISESIPVLLLLIRKQGLIAANAYTWVIAIVGTFAPLMVTIGGHAFVSAAVGGAIMFLGLLISISAKICLNRSFGIVAANRGIKRGGPYRLVRHPMYLGYVVAEFGFLLIHFSLANVLIYGVTWTAFVFRIRAEETFLKQDSAYRDYSAAVRFRIIPGVI
jgi:protein-S-isoprenylcysteine O-methyltransferase Ste14